MISNSDQKHIIKLHQKKYREMYGEYLIEGIKGVEEALASDVEVVSMIYVQNPDSKIKKLINKAEDSDVPVKECSKTQADKIKTTKTFPGVLAVVKKTEYELNDLADGQSLICLDRISDPGNLGTIIRTADWFGVKNILLSEGSVEAHNEKVVRSSMGSFFRVKIVESQNIISDLDYLKSEGYKVSGLDIEGENLKSSEVEKRGVFVFGSESHGISQDVAKKLDNTYTIEGKGDAESLNIAMSVGITLFKIN